MTWQSLGIITLVTGFVIVVVSLIWWRRSTLSRAEAIVFLRDQGLDLIRLPGRLRRVAADPRTPRRARWWLIGLAVYIASPIDPIPDFIPVLGYADELVIVPLVLRHIRRMIPDEIWSEYFPQRTASNTLDS